MNTPAHLVVNLALLAGGERRPQARAVAAGALLPDLPIFLFFLWESLVRGSPQALIWGELYFLPAWQDFFDLFNSVPFALAGLAAALALRRKGPALFCGSVLLHALADLPLHHDDGHRHFFPLWDARFASPVSYWDPAHYGAWGAGFEVLAVGLACTALWRRTQHGGWRALLLALPLLQVGGWVALYLS